MKIYLTLLSFCVYVNAFTQMSRRDINISCTIKKLKTHCLEKPNKKVSYISGYDEKKYFGRYEDFKEVLTLWQIKKIRENVQCYSKDSIKYNNNSKIEYSFDGKKGYGFYYMNNQYFSYKGTEEKINYPNYSGYNSASDKNYLLFYNELKENDDKYEVFYDVFDFKGNTVYTFHQRGNEFDEFTYKGYDESETKYIEENPLLKKKIYKNGKLNSIVKIQSNYKNGNIKKIKTYSDQNSYVLGENGVPVLVKSKYSNENAICNCKKGFVTKIKYQPEDKCMNEVFYD